MTLPTKTAHEIALSEDLIGNEVFTPLQAVREEIDNSINEAEKRRNVYQKGSDSYYAWSLLLKYLDELKKEMFGGEEQ